MSILDQAKNRDHTAESIDKILTSGYTLIDNRLWHKLPIGAKIVYFLKEESGIEEHEDDYGETPSTSVDFDQRINQFRKAGYLKQHSYRNGEHMLIFELKRGSDKSFVVMAKSISELWKAYPKDAFCEIHSILNRLALLEAKK